MTPAWLPSTAKQVSLIMKLKFPLLSCRFIIGFVLQVSFRVIEPNFLIRFQYKGFQVFQFPNVINVLI